ncbi:MAG: glycosyltransferase [Alphaproteobacteria bacterium]|nr:glycosyltransferase [Alphaproteobacteria bacterium]
MSAPTVSVIVPAYNARATILPTVTSALEQSHAPVEIIVVDDGSTDDTASIASSLPIPVRVIRKPNGGPASARNVGALAAIGEWLAFLDADDIFLPDKLRTQLSLADDPRIAILHGHSTDSAMDLPDELDFEALWERNAIVNSSVLLRRHVFDELGGFDESPDLISVEDYNMWLRVAAAGWRIRSCQQRLVRYTRGSGLSSQRDRFVKAQVANIRLIGQQFGLSEKAISSRTAKLFREIGKSALFGRDMAAARHYFRQARRADGTMGARLGLAVSYLPPALLDARRKLKWRYTHPSQHYQNSIDSIFVDHRRARMASRPGNRPVLLVIVDAEEEFDWATVPSTSIRVESVMAQHLAQRIFARYGIVPTYAVDYAVASQEEGYGPLREFMLGGQCDIGTQLHPWINPPLTEAMTVRNSFVGNLPETIQFEKLRILTETIRQNFGCDPILYRAGRYGAGAATVDHLKKLGYRIDTSVRPFYDMRSSGGPDYTCSPVQPYWCDQQRTLLEIPLTVGMLGMAAAHGREIYPWISGPTASLLRMPAILSRTNVLNRTSISPEGTPLSEAKALTRRVLEQQPNGVIVLTYHSTSLEPGNTPYVRSNADLRRFLAWLESYFDFFLGTCNGMASTPARLLAELSPDQSSRRLAPVHAPATSDAE